MPFRSRWPNDRLEQPRLPPVFDPKMLIGKPGGHSAPWSAIQKSYLDQKRLIAFSRRALLSSQRRGQRPNPARPAVVFLDDRQQQPPVNLVEAVLVHLKHLQRGLRRGLVNPSGASNLGEIAYT